MAKFKIGDTFTVHFDYYEPDEVTTHIIGTIINDGAFTVFDDEFEGAGVVYMSEDYVWIEEDELVKQKFHTELK